MASTYTSNTGIEKIGAGEQAGTWGNTTNNNLDIVDRTLNGVITCETFLIKPYSLVSLIIISTTFFRNSVCLSILDSLR